MASNRENNNRIAKNTILLYIRTVIVMAISLFTSRIVLKALGIEDYGVYNVVGGFVMMFSLLTGALSSAISRYLTFALGKGDVNLLKKVFSTSVTIQIAMAFGVFILAEVFGVWFLNTQLNIPAERMDAANWVFHFSVLSFVVSIVSVPYTAAVIAHEKMDVFAYMSIVEVMLKLIVVFLLYTSSFDKLVTYAILLTVVAVIIRILYGWYCRHQFEECLYKPILDHDLLKDMSAFSGWNMLGTSAYMFNTQGVNIVTNIFFGVTTNAARGIANQVDGIVRQCVSNFTTAINPQITKSYALGDITYMHSLICRGTRFSYLLMLLFVVPFMFETETIMHLWLDTYPDEAPLFLRLSMIGSMFDLLGNSTANAVWATGNVKRYYIYVGGVGALVFPLSWVCFVFGFDAYWSYIMFCIIYIILVFLKAYIIRDLVSFPLRMFVREVFYRIIPTTIVAFVAPSLMFFSMEPSLIRTIVVVLTSGLSTIVSIYFFGLTVREREIAIVQIKKYLHIK